MFILFLNISITGWVENLFVIYTKKNRIYIEKKSKYGIYTDGIMIPVVLPS